MGGHCRVAGMEAFIFRALEKILKASSKKDVALRESIEAVLGTAWRL